VINGPRRAKPGAPHATDWAAHAAAVAYECKTRGSVPPDPEGPKGWRTKADVERWTHDWLACHGDKAAPSTVQAHVNEALQKIVLENGQK